jgi:hypothetical protein
LHHKNVVPFLPDSAFPHLPKRFPQVFNYQLAEGSRHHFCSSECLDHKYNHYFDLIDAPARSSLLPELLKQKQQLDSEWSSSLPTVPPEMVIQAICLEIEATNPRHRQYHARNGKPHGIRTPKHKLKILEDFKPTNKSMADIEPLCQPLANYISNLLLDFSPFNVDGKLVLDIVKRIFDNHQTIVLDVNEGKSFEKYAAQVNSIDDKAFLDKSERELKVAGAGDLHLVWHPVVSALFTAQSLVNHSCSPNVYYSTISHDTPQLDVIASRDILPGEEITASYIDTSFLTLPVAARRAHIMSGFGFTCQCPACKIQTELKK